MKKYVCSICNYVYDQAKGVPDGQVAPGTKWDDLEDDWICPICGASKSEFFEEGQDETDLQPNQPILTIHDDMKELSPLEVSVLCDNLARACEKMYAFDEQAKFIELATYFKGGSAPAEDPSYGELLTLVEKDLDVLYPNAEKVAKDEGDRGALRALTWTVKSTRMLKSILNRYEKEGEAMLENTGVYVCTICGYIYIGDELPELCPVCKVVNWKFEKIEGGVA